MHKPFRLVKLGMASALVLAVLAGCEGTGSRADNELPATQTENDIESNKENAAAGNDTDGSDNGDETKAAMSTADGYDFSVSYDGIGIAEPDMTSSVHDPSIIKADGAYYIFGSHLTAAKSTDLSHFEMIADGYSPHNPVWTDLATENLKSGEFDYAGQKRSLIPTDDGSTHIWAPDVIYNEKTGLYYMYYCTSSTWNASNLCYGTSETVDGPYTWQGPLIYSGFTKDTIEATDVLDYVDMEYASKHYFKHGGYNTDDCPNAIDPTVFYDEDGRMWMVYGSWSGGIFLLELDEETGKVIHPEGDEDNRVDPYFGRQLLGGGHHSIEGPYILYDKESGYYYLFVSYGGLNRDGGYQIRVFRSETVDGDYVDMNGKWPDKKLDHSFFGLKLSGNYYLPSLKEAYMATGHNSAFIDDDGKMYICYHSRFENQGERHSPRVKQFFVNREGWPCMLPYTTGGEMISEKGYDISDIAGEYYVVNQGMDISSAIAQPVKLFLNEDGTVLGEDVSGTFESDEDTCYMDITIGDKSYSGIFCIQQDEAGSDVMTFSAAGNNESLWGVKYL